MFSIIKKELKDRRTSLFMYCLIAIFLAWLYVALFPSVQSQAQNFNKLIANYPESLKKAFNLKGSGFDSIESFLSVELFSFMWPLLAILLSISRSGNAIAGEVERNTIGTLLSLPVSRTRIFLSKYYSGLISIGLFTMFSILSPIPFAWVYHINTYPRSFLLCSIICFLFATSIYSISMIGSALFSERSKMYGIVGGSLFVMYTLNVVSGIRPSLDSLKYVSIFHYFNATDVLVNGKLIASSIVLFLLLTIVGVGLGLLTFKKRDISI